MTRRRPRITIILIMLDEDGIVICIIPLRIPN